MTVSQFLSDATIQLSDAGIDSARLDALLLLEKVLKKSRAELLADTDTSITEDDLKELDKILERRLRREPLAYIIGQKEFYGHTFYVTADVLIPRPESEAFLELSRTISLNQGGVALDVGTGSGCIGISYALEHEDTTVYLSDLSDSALVIANKNVKLLGATNAKIVKADLLNNVPKNVEIIFANLPYVPTTMKVEPELDHEPHQALYSENEGLKHYELLFAQLGSLNDKPQYVLTESLANQHDSLKKMASAAGYALAKTSDLVQLFILNIS